ncbi:sigma-70 family RNA polymerase sigma factor [Leptolyngbya sp. 7M]|uniref:sigma-70 family RNA polymerase sigma factor n=1 Tax=Leptolyngbya sp. 7M TaxID=2812896 RepID=UPI001B8BB68B|nr:sigma-70 family RNA polymerase sigma factor [Leptolyngbya sp. 7M]QYO63449.1 sigma-70 family RNA polymerase sigma factor [Leptolyngbya sp. 7M]
MGIPTQEPQKSFEQCWLEVRARVLAFCYRLMQNRNDAEDLFQEVAIRAWRGYSSFRGESSFSTWVLTIVRREATRRLKHSKHLLPLPQPETIPDPERDDPVDTSFVIRAIKEAEQMHILNSDEAKVLQMRLQNSELTWRELGDSLGLSANACAVNHTRALPKLRVYLFMYRPEWLGGDLAIRTAFAQAQRMTQSPLSREEAEVFEQIVLRQNHNYSRSGWKTRLSSACTKVIRFIHLD